ncbi:MAG: tetratricopeptide repeat protein, partial [Myxococcales bacterium]|nr:tetratricopeptide repeat protein [Myxococcales bacterium]
AAGRPERALAVWRAALGAGFIAQAAGLRRAEDRVGLFAGLKATRALLDHYPDVDPVAKALFLLPQRLDGLTQDELPTALVEQGVTPTDLRLMAAQWDRDWLARRPTDDTAPEAGFHLVRTLLKLEAFDQAARWARDLAAVHPKSPQLDGLLYLQGLALSRKGDGEGALALFERIAREQFPTAEGGLGPAPSRGDARFAAARAYEALGRWDQAKAAYKEAAADQPDAQAAQDALARVRLSAPRFLTTAEPAAKLSLTTSNLPKVNVQAYKLDVRTLFVRDAGLTGVHDVRIAGVSPAWTESVDGHAGPYPKAVDKRVKLPSPGAWLLVVDGGAEDVVQATGSGWAAAPAVTVAGVAYAVLRDGPVELRVARGVTVQ